MKIMFLFNNTKPLFLRPELTMLNTNQIISLFYQINCVLSRLFGIILNVKIANNCWQLTEAKKNVWRSQTHPANTPLRQWARDAVQDHLAHVHVIGGSQPGTVVLSDLVYERFTFVFFNGLWWFF